MFYLSLLQLACKIAAFCGTALHARPLTCNALQPTLHPAAALQRVIAAGAAAKPSGLLFAAAAPGHSNSSAERCAALSLLLAAHAQSLAHRRQAVGHLGARLAHLSNNAHLQVQLKQGWPCWRVMEGI